MIARACRALALAGLRAGSVTLVEPDGRRRLGSGMPAATLQVRSARAWPKMLRGSRGLAEGYEHGLWDSPDLVALIRLFAANLGPIDRARARLAPLLAPARALSCVRRPNTRSRRRSDIAAHYDLGQELFELMLDPTLSYSCALFEHEGDSLEQAQLAKLERVCEKLELTHRDHLLEIGTGWGALAVHAAATRGCRVTTTTISSRQYEHARASVRRAGLEDRVTVCMLDYRDLRGRYDKLVSIEMIEAVGWRHLAAFFAKCSQLLVPDGALLLQAITIDDRLYEAEKAARSFVNTRVFPGGCLPSLEIIQRSVARHTDMHTLHLQDITAHYVHTLRRWRERFTANADLLAARGYDERFQRIWTLYLAYCEAGFAERRIRDVQLLLAKPRWRPSRSTRPLRVAPAQGLHAGLGLG